MEEPRDYKDTTKINRGNSTGLLLSAKTPKVIAFKVCSINPNIGQGGRLRPDDLLVPNQTDYQLSHTLIFLIKYNSVP